MELAGIIPGKILIITAETRENPVSLKEINIMIKECLT